VSETARAAAASAAAAVILRLLAPVMLRVIMLLDI